MITTLNIKCPHCGQSSQIFLSTSVSVIILNCPACLSPIMYFRKKVVLLDSNHEPGGGHRRPKAIDIGPVPDRDVDGRVSAPAPVTGLLPLRQGTASCGRRAITEDDCTNLRIELELCNDSKHFIDQI